MGFSAGPHLCCCHSFLSLRCSNFDLSSLNPIDIHLSMLVDMHSFPLPFLATIEAVGPRAHHSLVHNLNLDTPSRISFLLHCSPTRHLAKASLHTYYLISMLGGIPVYAMLSSYCKPGNRRLVSHPQTYQRLPPIDYIFPSISPWTLLMSVYS